MDRREDTRFPVQFPVEFTIIGAGPLPIRAWVRDVSEGGLRLEMAAALEPGCFLRIKVDDTIVFAEVRYSCPWQGGAMAGLYVERVLAGNSAISKLLARELQHSSEAESSWITYDFEDQV